MQEQEVAEREEEIERESAGELASLQRYYKLSECSC